jgi:hypothetical protein
MVRYIHIKKVGVNYFETNRVANMERSATSLEQHNPSDTRGYMLRLIVHGDGDREEIVEIEKRDKPKFRNHK